MTDAQRAARAKRVAKTTTFGYRVRPHSPAWNEVMRLLDEIIVGSGTPPPPPPPPNNYAPRAYNSTPSADARFCMDAKYGTVRDGAGYRDAMAVQYDESGRDLGGRSKTIVPELKGANSMDGREPCDEYVGPTGRTIGGEAGYPAASFEQ